MHSIWASQDDKIGYVLVNWSGEPEQVTLELVRNKGIVKIVNSSGNSHVPEREVATGKVSATVPPRSVALVEQS